MEDEQMELDLDLEEVEAPEDTPTVVATYGDFVIEEGIAIPERRYNRASRYPFAVLEVGQTFVAPDSSVKAMSSYAGSMGKRLGRKFATRTVEDGSGVRVWRIE